MEALPAVELTLILGRPAQAWALGGRDKGSMDATVRAWREFLPDILVLPHPSWRNIAWLNANPWIEETVTPYLRARVAAMIDR
jgi:uracil-DNA glycosylase